MYFLLPPLFLRNIWSFFSLFYPSKHVTSFSVLKSYYLMEVIPSIIYHHLSIISNLGFHQSLKSYHFQYYVYMRVCISAYLNYKFPGFHRKWPQKVVRYTTRKLINTNGNTEGIFLSVNFRGILPTEIFPRYIPRELPWEKKLKQSKKKMMTCHFYQRNYQRNKFRRWFRW